MIKILNVETECYVTVGILKTQKKELQKEAKKLGITMAKTIRNKLFPK